MTEQNTTHNIVELATQKSKKTKAKKAKKSDIELIIEGEEQYTNDISGLANINELYESSPIKKWIKVISTEKTILLDEYNRKDHFIPIADILDGISNQSEVMTQAEYDASIPTNFVRLSYS